MADDMGAEGGIAPESSSDGSECDPQPVGPPAQPEKPSSPLLSNDDIEKLLAGVGDDGRVDDTPDVTADPSAEAAQASGNQLLSNDDLEALLAAMESVTAEPAAEAPASPEETAPALEQTTNLLSNADIEKLLANMEGPHDEPAPSPAAGDAAVPEELQEVAPPPVAQSSDILNADELEKLLASVNAHAKEAAANRAAPKKSVEPAAEEIEMPAAPEQEVAPPVGKQTSELLSNEDIEKLLGSLDVKPAPPVQPSVAEVPPEAAAPAETQTSELLSNADIENLLSSMSPTPGANSADEAALPADTGSAELLSNDDIEGVLASVESRPDTGISNEPVEAALPADAGSAELLNNDDIDALLAGLDSSADAAAETSSADNPPEDPAPNSEEPAEVPASGDVESMLSTLDGGSGGEDAATAKSAGPEPASEAAKGESAAQPEVLSQDLIESLVRGARHRQGEPEHVAPPEPPRPVEIVEEAVAEKAVPEPPAKKPFGKPGWLTTRLAASLALGFFSGSCVYLYLVSHPYRPFDAKAMQQLRVSDPGQAMGVAAGLAQGDRHSEARNELKAVLTSLPPGEARTNAEFLDAEAAYHLLPDEAKIPVLKDLIRTLDRLLTEAPNHPKAREALLWKADLLKRSDMPEAAYEVYSQILTRPENPPNLDQGLLGAATTALQIERPGDAIHHLRRLLQAYPSSPLLGEAEYRLGEAYLASGDTEAGRMTLMSVARAHPDSALGAEAFARLGGLSYDAGDYDEAIRLFETRLQTATKVAGNDKIYLLLARAHRVKGDLAQAERVLRELVDFFPESAEIPAALVELSQVLDGLGRRDEAVQIAKQAAQQYANDAAVLANAGHFLVDTGEVAAGADTLVAAEHAGAENPAVLLEAARQYRAAKELDKAAEIYQRILDDYSNSSEAFRSGIELARVDYEKGRVRAALARMEENAADAKGRPAYAVALDALASLYAELGLRNRAMETFREMAGETSDPVMLARAAATLFDAGAAEDAFALVGRIDKGALPEPLAYGLLMREGAALAQTNPEQALALMEQAYLGYPNDRRSEDVQRLLDSYLALDRTAAARALVVDAETRAKADPSEIPTLEAAAARWGDHLYARGDFTAAGEAYALAAGAAGGDGKAARSEASLWSRYQQANCLYRLENLTGSLPLFEEVAGSASRWGDLARAKADYVGLEMRRRGIVPPEPVVEEPAQAAPAEPPVAQPAPPASEG